MSIMEAARGDPTRLPGRDRARDRQRGRALDDHPLLRQARPARRGLRDRPAAPGAGGGAARGAGILVRHFLERCGRATRATTAWCCCSALAAVDEEATGRMKELFARQMLPALAEVRSRTPPRSARGRPGLLADAGHRADPQAWLGSPPMAGMAQDDLVARVGPTVQAYLTAPLPSGQRCDRGDGPPGTPPTARARGAGAGRTTPIDPRAEQHDDRDRADPDRGAEEPAEDGRHALHRAVASTGRARGGSRPGPPPPPDRHRSGCRGRARRRGRARPAPPRAAPPAPRAAWARGGRCEQEPHRHADHHDVQVASQPPGRACRARPGAEATWQHDGAGRREADPVERRVPVRAEVGLEQAARRRAPASRRAAGGAHGRGRRTPSGPSSCCAA